MMAAPSKLADAFYMVKDWADHHFISDGCRPKEAREPGCLSCDALHFLEAMEEALLEDAGDAQ